MGEVEKRIRERKLFTLIYHIEISVSVLKSIQANDEMDRIGEARLRQINTNSEFPNREHKYQI